MSSITNSLWVEKYRPKTLEDVILPETYMNDFKRIIERQEIGNLLFSGSPGSGKSTMARILTSKYGVLQNKKSNLLEINGSAKETRNIAFVSDVIEPFFRSPPVGNDKYKILYIDECDSFHAFEPLRGIIEKYQLHYGRFIFTCNYIVKIPTPIQSRFTIYKFKQMPTEFIFKYCKDILEKENIKYDNDDLNYIISNLYPDVRQIVNVLNRSSFSGRLTIDKNTAITNEKLIISNIIDMIGFIKNKQNNKIGKCINTIIDIVKDKEIDYTHIYESLFYMKDVPIQCKIIINEYSNNQQHCLIPSLHFNAFVFKMGTVLMDYMKATGK